MQIKTIMRYHFILVRMAIIKKSTNNKFLEKVWRKGNPPTLLGNVSWYNHFGEQYGGRFLKKLNIELPYDPAIRLPVIYWEKTIIQKDTCPPVFIAALVPIAKI